eukprot:5810122-Karenia_brevis.AAC.1
MLPKDYQEEILKMGSGDTKLEYEKVKSYVLSLAQQRASSMQPRPSEVLGVEGQEEAAQSELSRTRAFNAGSVAKWATWAEIA